jgi:LEA14-like dessication related protein
MMKRAMLVTVLGALVGVLACVPRVQQPQVWLEGARLSSLGISGGVIDVRLSVHNPNRFAVEARALTYDLALRDPDRDRWVDFTEGRIDGDLRVPGRDTLEVMVPVEFSYRGLGQAMRSLIERGSFDYRLSGVVELRGPVRRDIRYNHTGRYAPAPADEPI